MSKRLTANPVGLLQTQAPHIEGVLSCYDRVIVTGTIPDCCHPAAMAHQLFERKLKYFAYAEFVKRVRDRIVDQVQEQAAAAGLEIEFIRRSAGFCKEDYVQQILEQRGAQPGLVHMFSVMERCSTFKPWTDRKRNKTALRWSSGKCLHYYIYFIDEMLGLCFLRIPTWAPFKLQFYFNGHNYLARQMDAEGLAYVLRDNAFVHVADYDRAQELADSFSTHALHQRLDQLVARFVPVKPTFRSGYHWSLSQIEYATDIVFRHPDKLNELYDELVKTAVHAVEANNVAIFLGRKGLHPLYEGELTTQMQTRVKGTCIRHHMGAASIKMYDKFAQILRIETTSNDVSFFKHHRKVYRRDGTSEMKLAGVRKTIHNLGVMRDLMSASNGRYLRFISELANHSEERKNLDKISRRVRDDRDRSHRGLNLFNNTDLQFVLALLQGEHCISGFTNRMLQTKLPQWSSSQISRALKRLRVHGLIRRIRNTYKYYPTRNGQRLLIAALKLKEHVIIPALATS